MSWFSTDYSHPFTINSRAIESRKKYCTINKLLHLNFIKNIGYIKYQSADNDVALQVLNNYIISQQLTYTLSSKLIIGTKAVGCYQEGALSTCWKSFAGWRALKSVLWSDSLRSNMSANCECSCTLMSPYLHFSAVLISPPHICQRLSTADDSFGQRAIVPLSIQLTTPDQSTQLSSHGLEVVKDTFWIH